MNINEVTYHLEQAFIKAGYDFRTANIKVSINNRLTRTHGRCRTKIINNIYTPVLIEFSPILLNFTEEKDIISIIYHEAAHALVTLETREAHGHDIVFKNMCKRIGTPFNTPSATVKRTVEEDKLYKYFIKCEKCDKIVAKYHRAGSTIQNIDSCYCKKCKGKLKVIQNW